MANDTQLLEKAPAWQAQLEALTQLPNYHQVFQAPVPNNYHLVVCNQAYPSENTKEDIMRVFHPLNQATGYLGQYVRDAIEALKQENKPEHKDIVQEMELELDGWRTDFRAGNVFLTFGYVQKLFALFGQAGVPILKKLHQEKQELLLRFCQIPHAAKSFVRLSVYAPFDHLNAFTARFIARMQKETALFYYAERVEIAKQRVDEYHTSRGHQGAKSFPTFNLYFNTNIVSTHRHPIIAEMAEMLNLLSSGMPEQVMQTQYAKPMGHNITMSQGYTNYKNYLKLMGILDWVYDPAHNHAYARPQLQRQPLS